MTVRTERPQHIIDLIRKTYDDTAKQALADDLRALLAKLK